MQHRLFGIIISLFLSLLAEAQYYNLGQDPSSLKWRQIYTQNFTLIYPESFESKAQKLPAFFEQSYKNVTKTLAYNPKPIPFIFHNYNVEPNAVTVWAPKRVEIFTCPPQDTYAQDWIEQLILHEYRHVVQLDRTNQGFTKFLSYFTGQQAAAAINGLFVPSWFMEGDAVCTETLLSKSGRGRIPSFEMPLRTQVTELGAFTYDKAAFGSYKSFVPNSYVLGYSLVANVRRHYGYQAWVTALDQVARKPYLITPFNIGLKKATGFGKETLYSMTMKDMDSLWKYQDRDTPVTSFKDVDVSKRYRYENYKFPHYINDTLIIAEYTSLDDITRFVLIGTNGYRKIVTTPGFISSEKYSVIGDTSAEAQASTDRAKGYPRDFKLVFTESINDHRWGQRNYSVLRVYSSASGTTTELTNKSRYFAPAFSPDGKQVAAITVSPDNRCSVVIIDVDSGKETDTIISSLSNFYMTPSWSRDGSKIVFTKSDVKGKSIVVYEFSNKISLTIVQPTFTEIANPVFVGDYVLFNGSYSGIENIYAVDLKNRNEIFQVTSARFGSCNPNLSHDGSKIVYSNYTATGYSLVEAEFVPGKWKPLSAISDYSPSLYKYLLNEESVDIETKIDSTIRYTSEPYRKGKHIFNFHSWAPAYINYMEGENAAGVSFMSQNDLSTATTIVGYKYDMAENTGKITLDFSWQAWYPMIDIKSSVGARAAYTGGDSSERYNFNETMISSGLTLPLIFTGGPFYKGIQLQAFSTWYNITNNTSTSEDKLTGTIHSFDYSLYLYRYIKQAYKDLFPRWGQAFSVKFRHSPLGDNDMGNIASAMTRFYFPGFSRHHGIRIDLSWQQIIKGSYSYSNQINLPRGYDYTDATKITCFAFNYKFPFAYPDFSLGPLVYFKRFKANLFFDGGLAEGYHYSDQKLQSTGVELTSDMHIVRFVFPVDLGVRLGYRPLDKQYFADFLFSVNL